MNFQFQSPPFNAEYYRRRWTIRFCILGLTMLLLDSAALVSVNLVSHKGLSNGRILIALAPFFIHSLQLISAVVLLRSQRKDPKFLKRCSTWCWRCKILTPFISVEAFVLSMWEFNRLIILLTISLYIIAVTKVYHLFNQALLPEILRVALLRQSTGAERSNQTEQDGETTEGMELETKELDDDEGSLPSYAQAVQNLYTQQPRATHAPISLRIIPM